MTTLYIIGNGFDRWHGLPTSYDHFYEFAKDALDDLDSYFCIDTTKNGPWHDFENCLGTYDWSLLYEDHNHTDVTADSFRPSEAYGLEDELDEQTDSLIRIIRDRRFDGTEEDEVRSRCPLSHIQLHLDTSVGLWDRQ